MSFRCDSCDKAQPPTTRPTFVCAEYRNKEYPPRKEAIPRRQGAAVTYIDDKGGFGTEPSQGYIKLCPSCSGTYQSPPLDRFKVKCDECHRYGAYLAHEAFSHVRFDTLTCINDFVTRKFGKENLSYKTKE